jgi:hypothetical protein
VYRSLAQTPSLASREPKPQHRSCDAVVTPRPFWGTANGLRAQQWPGPGGQRARPVYLPPLAVRKQLAPTTGIPYDRYSTRHLMQHCEDRVRVSNIVRVPGTAVLVARRTPHGPRAQQQGVRVPTQWEPSRPTQGTPATNDANQALECNLSVAKCRSGGLSRQKCSSTLWQRFRGGRASVIRYGNGVRLHKLAPVCKATNCAPSIYCLLAQAVTQQDAAARAIAATAAYCLLDYAPKGL